MVVPQNAVFQSSAAAAATSRPNGPSPTAPPSASTSAPSLSRSKTGNVANGTSMPSNIPLSARRADPLDMSKVERKNASSPTWKGPISRTHVSGIPEAPSYHPTKDEWANPMEYMKKIAPEGRKYGIVKLVPPESWCPDFAVDTERFHFRTRRQELNSCEGGTRANLDYLDQLAKFHRSQGMNLNRFPSVDKRPLDLYELKKAVDSRGGFENVCKGKKWAEIGRILGYSGKIMSSLSTSLKNSYAKWLEPYERFVQGVKPGVQMRMEQERGGPYATPSPGASPMQRTASQPFQPSPSSLSRSSPVIRASDTLNSSLESPPRHIPPQSLQPQHQPSPPKHYDLPRPPAPTGFTAVNAGGFTPINARPTSPYPAVNGSGGSQEKKKPDDMHNRNAFGSFHTSTFAPNGFGPHDLKRAYSEMASDSDTNTRQEMPATSKRVKQESAPTVTGSHMTQPRPSATGTQSLKERHNWKPGDYCENCGKGNDDKNILICDSCYKGFHTYCLDPPLKAVPDFDWHCPKCLVGTGEFGFEEGGIYSLEEFRQRAKKFKENHFASKPQFDAFNHPRDLNENDVEREFWRLVSSLTETVEVEYGADIHSTTHGSGFPTIETHPRNPYSADPWNLNILPLHPESLFRYIKSDISGMTVPWLYVGMVFSTFCWHNEDHYTYSANFQHFGDTKTWYGIPGEDAERFEEAMRKAVPDLFEKQPDLLFQLVTLLSPEQLKKAGVNVYAADQRAGEFIITFPQAYHSGFNHGFNFNEAVNFAPSDWEPFGQAGVERLRDFRRQPCFSHDELLLTAAGAKDVSIKTAKWLAPALERILGREMVLRQAFESRVQGGKFFTPRDGDSWLIQFERRTDYEDLPEEQYICAYCKSFSYLSRFVCPVSGKTSCLEHIRETDCCHTSETHCLHVRMTSYKLEQIAQRVVEKARMPEAWTEKLEAAISESPKPQLKTLRSLLSEGEKIPWDLPQLPQLKKFVDRCNEWVEEATNYITRKQQNRRKNDRVWRRGSQAKASDLDDRDREMRKLDNIQKLLDEADHIGFDSPEIATLQERADAIAEFQNDARSALTSISFQTTQQITDLIEIGRGFNLEIPELDHLDKIVRQMRWRDKASQRNVQWTLPEVEGLLEEASNINVPEHNEHLLYLQDQKLRGEMWDKKAKELMAVDNVHFPQLDSLSKQAVDLPVNKDTLAAIDAILKKQREIQDRIAALYRRTQAPEIGQRPLYSELNDVIGSVSELNSKPLGLVDLEREQKRHEDWMRRGKRLFGKSNAPLHILMQHLKIVDNRNKSCLDRSDKPRMPVEPSSRQQTPEPEQESQSGSKGDVFCLCRTAESGMMIECHVCHEWYHSKCLKIARGKVKEEEDFVCPICDHRVKIPRDANRPKLEEIAALKDEIRTLPFQPEEQEVIQSIVEVGQAFREDMQQYIHPNPVMATPDEVPIMRFYLRKIEGADILLAEETNFFRQELYRFAPRAPEPPPIIEMSNSTRKPRPTKQQKLMAQHGVDNPDDLPEHVRQKATVGRKRQSTEDERSKQRTPKPQRSSQGPSAPGYAKPAQPRVPQRGYPFQSHKNTPPGVSSSQLNFKPPLTATAFPQYHSQDNRLAPRPGDPMFSNSGPPCGALPSLGSPFSGSGESSGSHNPNLDPGLLERPSGSEIGGFEEDMPPYDPAEAASPSQNGSTGHDFPNMDQERSPSAANMFASTGQGQLGDGGNTENAAAAESTFDDSAMFADLTNQDEAADKEEQHDLSENDRNEARNKNMVDPTFL